MRGVVLLSLSLSLSFVCSLSLQILAHNRRERRGCSSTAVGLLS